MKRFPRKDEPPTAGMHNEAYTPPLPGCLSHPLDNIMYRYLLLRAPALVCAPVGQDQNPISSACFSLSFLFLLNLF